MVDLLVLLLGVAWVAAALDGILTFTFIYQNILLIVDRVFFYVEVRLMFKP